MSPFICALWAMSARFRSQMSQEIYGSWWSRTNAIHSARSRRCPRAITFSKADVPSSAAAAFPEIAQIVLAKSAEHLDEIWGGDRKDVGRNLLVLATRRTMEALA